MFARVVLAVLLVGACVACARPPEEERSSLCEDLGNLAATVALIADPPQDATVGEVRGATEKLDPTINQAESAGVVPDELADGFRADQEAVLAAFEGIGDDTEVVDVPAAMIAPTDVLVERYAQVVATLGCGSMAGATG